MRVQLQLKAFLSRIRRPGHAAFLAAAARDGLRTFFAFFLEVFFLAVATTNSFMDQT